MKIFFFFLILIFLLFSFVQSNKATKNIKCQDVEDIKEATDCFNTILDAGYETCCFFEFKKKDEYVRERYCLPLQLKQFLEIGDTIEDIENKNNGIKIYSLECDKDNFLIVNIFVLIIMFILMLF